MNVIEYTVKPRFYGNQHSEIMIYLFIYLFSQFKQLGK